MLYAELVTGLIGVTNDSSFMCAYTTSLQASILHAIVADSRFNKLLHSCLLLLYFSHHIGARLRLSSICLCTGQEVDTPEQVLF